jgi:hypothetical protein
VVMHSRARGGGGARTRSNLERGVKQTVRFMTPLQG